jgi:hypothetical protein
MQRRDDLNVAIRLSHQYGASPAASRTASPFEFRTHGLPTAGGRGAVTPKAVHGRNLNQGLRTAAVERLPKPVMPYIDPPR